MINIVFLLILGFAIHSKADGPLYHNDDVVTQQEFDNVYQDLRRINNKNIPFVNVKDFGAQGDGITNDFNAIQTAHNSIVSSGKSGTLYFPAGTYKINSGLTFNTSYVSILGSSSRLDFSSLTGSTWAITMSGGANIYSTANPYFNADKYIANLTLIGPGQTSNVSGLVFYSAAEPGPSHFKSYNLNITQFGTGVFLSSNSYINDFYGCDIWSSSMCVVVDNAINSGEGNVFHGCRFFNSNTGFILNNPNADTYIEGGSIDGMSSNFIVQTMGDFHVNHTHFEGNFTGNDSSLHFFYIPSSMTAASYSYFDNCYFTMKTNRTVPAFSINYTDYFHLTNSHVTGVGTVSQPVIASSYAAVSFIDTQGTIFTVSDTNVSASTNTIYWQSQENANAVLSNRVISYTGTTTNDSVAIGYVGESSECFVGAGVPISSPGTGQYFDICSVFISSGDWDIYPQSCATQNAATITAWNGGIGTVSGNDTTNVTYGKTFAGSPPPVNAYDVCAPVSKIRMSLTSGTTIYLKGDAIFSAGTPKGYGHLSTRRPR